MRIPQCLHNRHPSRSKADGVCKIANRAVLERCIVTVMQLCLQEGGHPSLHPTPSTPHPPQNPAGPSRGKAAGVHSPLHSSPPGDGPNTRQQGCAAALLPHPILPQITSLLLPLFSVGGGRWKQSSSCGSDWLKLYEGRRHRTSFLPSAPRTRS